MLLFCINGFTSGFMTYKFSNSEFDAFAAAFLQEVDEITNIDIVDFQNIQNINLQTALKTLTLSSVEKQIVVCPQPHFQHSSVFHDEMLQPSLMETSMSNE